ncbi:sugar phosphate isomerase/epimerase family protein [Candidatus Latescibacterota bacterium]
MRLCCSDSGIDVAGDKTENQRIMKKLYDVGFRVVGLHTSDLDVSANDVDYAKNSLMDAGLVPGPFGGGRATFHPDPVVSKQYKQGVAKTLRIGGKLGCSSVRYSIGSMHPRDVWRHHPENHTQKALDKLVESTRDLLTLAEDCDCMLCPETNAWTIVNSVERMKEYVDRLDSPYAKVIFDPVNHMNPQRTFESAKYMTLSIAYLGDCIGELHVKDAQVMDNYMIHIEEADVGEGLLDHAAIIKASTQLEPWETFSLEHFNGDNGDHYMPLIESAYNHIQGIANSIGHAWSDPNLTRQKWDKIKQR